MSNYSLQKSKIIISKNVASVLYLESEIGVKSFLNEVQIYLRG